MLLVDPAKLGRVSAEPSQHDPDAGEAPPATLESFLAGIDAAPRDLTMGDATGLGRLGQVGQWELPHTAPNYVQKEMGYAVARRHAAKLRRLVIVAMSIAILSMLASLTVPYAAVLSMVLTLFASVVQRWLFFAEAQHVVTLFYGARAA